MKASAEVTTIVQDPLRGEVLLRISGALALPVGSVIELAGGERAEVYSLRLVAIDGAPTQLIVQVVRVPRQAGGG